MGSACARVKLANACRPDLGPVEVEACADTDTLHLCLPQDVARELQLEEQGTREVTLPNGTRQRVPDVGPVLVSVANRRCCTGAIVFGSAPVLGMLPVQDMNLFISSDRRELVVNPVHHFPGVIAKGLPPSARAR